MSKFRFKSKDDTVRLIEIEQAPDNGLKDQRALCDWLIEKAIEDGSKGLANSLLNTSAKLLVAHEASQIRANELLSKSAISAFMQKVSEAVIEEANKLSVTPEERNKFIDAIHARIAAAMQEGAKNAADRVSSPLKGKA
jgi:hypothetical protein